MNPEKPSGWRLLLVLLLLLPALPVAARRGGGANNSPAPSASAARPYRGSAAGVAGPAAVISAAVVGRSPKVAAAVAAPASREHEVPRVKNPANLAAPLAPAGSNRVEDSSGRSESREGVFTARAAASPTVSFEGPDYTGRIPPDPHAAAGPNHIVAAVNSKFGFFTKSGTELYESTANAWFKNVLPQVEDIGGTFDPKVVYDHTAGRWIIVYLATDSTSESWILVSVSNTSDPMGNWCNIPLRGDRNGNTPSGNWADYEGVGLDSQAVYITTNQFQLTPNADGGFQYARIRIIPKTQLYGACSSPAYFDFWDLTDPASTNERAFTLRPALTFGTPGAEYLVSNSPFETSTYFTLWTITNPVSLTPNLTARNVPVTASTAPPNADQAGGSAGTGDCPAPCLIDTGDGRLLDLVYRNGSLWTSHAVAGGTGDAYSVARYVRIGVTGPTPAVLEDSAIGLDGCWYYYPAVAVDQNNNLGMVFSRSCTDTYAGIRYTGRTPSDPDLQGSTLLKSGENNYVNPASGKNRFGDYSGAAVDPVDPTKLWLFGEYAASPANKWGTWAGQVAITSEGGGVCVASATVLCLNNSRFRVSAAFQTPSGGGTANGVALTGDTGYFWFFSANNVEIVIKVVDGRPVNSRYWVFAGGLTNVNVVITVTDMQTGAIRTYTNPQGVAFQPIQDTSAFAAALAPGGLETSSSTPVAPPVAAISAEISSLLERSPSSPARPQAPNACIANATTLCLNNNRFTVRTQWASPTASGIGQAVGLTGDTGYFWFFSANNVEMVTKVVTGCGFNSRYWVFAGGLTNVNVVMTVTDTATGAVRTYVNPQNTAFQPIQDTSAFPCP